MKGTLTDILASNKEAVLNILNEDRMRDYVANLALTSRGTSNKFVEEWIKTIFLNWLRKQPVFFKRIVPDSIYGHPAFQYLLDTLDEYNDHAVKEFNKTVLVITSVEPVWAQQLFLEGKLSWFANPSVAFQSTILHVIDYLLKENFTKRIGHSVPEVFKLVQQWDVQLERQVLTESLSKGVDVVYEFEGTPFYVVKLIKPNAYKAEGQAMGHCVENYIDRDCEIYSLRSRKKAHPIATIEVRQESMWDQSRMVPHSGIAGRMKAIFDSQAAGRKIVLTEIVQIQKKSKAALTDEELALLDQWATESFHDDRIISKYLNNKNTLVLHEDDDEDNEDYLDDEDEDEGDSDEDLEGEDEESDDDLEDVAKVASRRGGYPAGQQVSRHLDDEISDEEAYGN
jgi:hypothetical protein